jgi:hypothetical protein
LYSIFNGVKEKAEFTEPIERVPTYTLLSTLPVKTAKANAKKLFLKA